MSWWSHKCRYHKPLTALFWGWGLFYVSAILGIMGVTKQNDEASGSPWIWQTKPVSFWMVLPLRILNGLWLNLNTLQEQTLACLMESIISFILLYYLGFQTGVKEITSWVKKAWESVVYLCARAGGMIRNLPCATAQLVFLPLFISLQSLGTRRGRGSCQWATHSYLRN